MMFGEDDDFDNSAIDLNRVRKLAGLPNTGTLDDTASTMASVYEPETDYDLGLDDEDLDSEDMIGSGGMSAPAPIDISPVSTAPALAVEAPLPQEQSHWSVVLTDLEHQMPEIPVGDFREVIDSLRRLANYAEDIRRTLVTEGKKSFKEYVAEALQGVPTVPPVKSSTTSAPKPSTASSSGTNLQTIGKTRQEAVKAIQSRMGQNGNPMQAQKVYDHMQRNGMVKANGGQISMQTMNDEEFGNVLNDPQLNQ